MCGLAVASAQSICVERDARPPERGCCTVESAIRPGSAGASSSRATVLQPSSIALVSLVLVTLYWHSAQGASPIPPEIESTNLRQSNTYEEGSARGGGQQADFDSLIELIQTTIAPDTWQDVGGEGSISGFPGGVYVDAAGVLRTMDTAVQQRLVSLWDSAQPRSPKAIGSQDIGRVSRCRKVSLRRLQEQLTHRRARDEAPSWDVHFLAGLQRIDLVFLDEQSGDCILAGPAGPWTINDEGRCVGIDSRRPVVRLDDLVVVLRNAFCGEGQFLCAITPLPENLERTQQYLTEWDGRPVRPQERDAWLGGLRQALGRQQIEFAGIEADTRVARVLIEADHHMKLVGLGLVPSAGQLVSYLDTLSEKRNGPPPDLGVLRWWFALQERCLQRSGTGDIYVLQNQVVRVLSENELLAARGQRVHTGRAEPLNAQFARDFTKSFPALSQQYPVYAELDNVFRLAIVAALLRREEFPLRTGWMMEDLLDDATYRLPRARVPKSVVSVVNYRVVDQRYFLAAVSGGVAFRSDDLLSHGFDTRPLEETVLSMTLRPPAELDPDAWWWD